MSTHSKPDEHPRSAQSLQDILDAQRRMIEATREFDSLTQVAKSSAASELPKALRQLAEVTTVLLAYTQEISELAAQYWMGQ